MYAGPEFPPWNGPGPGTPQPPRGPAPALRFHLALLLYPLTAGVLGGAAVPLVLLFDPDAGWRSLGTATLGALLLAMPSTRLLAARLLRRRAGERA